MKWLVYIHISPSNKRYVGITSKDDPYKRWGNNGTNYKNNKYFYRAIEKYGWDNFQHIIVARGLDEETAKWLEIELIRELDTINPNKGYNLTKGGDGVNGYKHSEERRKKCARNGEMNGMYGKYHTDEAKEKMSKKKKDIYNGSNNPNAKRVLCIELGIIFNTINEAAKFIKRNQSRISDVLNNGGTAGGYHWEYVDKEVGE